MTAVVTPITLVTLITAISLLQWVLCKPDVWEEDDNSQDSGNAFTVR